MSHESYRVSPAHRVSQKLTCPTKKSINIAATLCCARSKSRERQKCEEKRLLHLWDARDQERKPDAEL